MIYREAKNYIAAGVILIFIILFLLFPWKPILVIMLAWMSLNAFYTAKVQIKKITEKEIKRLEDKASSE